MAKEIEQSLNERALYDERNLRLHNFVQTQKTPGGIILCRPENQNGND